MDEFQLGWITGLYEGEGSCGVYAYARGNHVRLTINSTDRDVVERVRDLTGVGSITTSQRANPKHKPLHKWQVQNCPDVLSVCQLLRPHMHSRRVEQMDPVIAFCKDRIANPRRPGPLPGTGGRPRMRR